MSKTIISSDSKSIIRGEFKGQLSCAIIFREPEKFKEGYSDFMKKLFQTEGKEMKREIYKSFELGFEFVDNQKKFYDILLGFAKFLNGQNAEVNVVYTSLYAPKLKGGINLYGEGIAVKRVNVPTFIDIVGTYHNYIPIWKLHNIGQDLSSFEILLDCFEGEFTRAWDDIKDFNISIIPEGDKCNIFVSASDLCCKFIDILLKVKRERLGDDILNEIFKKEGLNNFKAIYSGHQDLKYLVPISNHKIKIENYYKRPMIFVLKEGISGSESKIFEGSIYWDSILNLASKLGGGVKHMDYSQDASKIKDIDYIIYTGPRGEEQAKRFLEWGYKFNCLNFKQVGEELAKCL